MTYYIAARAMLHAARGRMLLLGGVAMMQILMHRRLV